VTLSRRRLLALSAALPFVGNVRLAHGMTAIDLRALVRSGLDRDATGAVTSIFGLTRDAADGVLLRATREDALPDGYRPLDLVGATTRGIPANGVQQLRALIVDDTRALLDSAAAEGLDLYVGSGYRSEAYQAAVFTAQTSRWGDPETANRYSARPGYSQHQLGTTLDLTLSFRAFRESAAPDWLRANAHQFGFVLPYTSAATERTGYVDEPWHARWIGADLASLLHQANYHNWSEVDADDAIALVRQESGLDG
jgi:LAS superfamily LD-carboxypeptidase LdcB